MNSLNVFMFVAAAVLALSCVSAKCPPAHKVSNATPTCFSDADCQKWGKICCPNQHNTKSCIPPAPWLDNGKTTMNKNAVWCGGVMCKPYEICKTDPRTNKQTCVRA